MPRATIVPIIPNLSKASEEDKKLVSLSQQIYELTQHADAVVASFTSARSEDPEGLYNRHAELLTAAERLGKQMCERRATSLEGLRAKAVAALSLWHHDLEEEEHEEEVDQALVRSLLIDLIKTNVSSCARCETLPIRVPPGYLPK